MTTALNPAWVAGITGGHGAPPLTPILDESGAPLLDEAGAVIGEES